MLRNSRTPQDAPAVNSGGWVRYWRPIFRLPKMAKPFRESSLTNPDVDWLLNTGNSRL